VPGHGVLILAAEMEACPSAIGLREMMREGAVHGHRAPAPSAANIL
jgi:hypothetical protein